MLFRTRIHPLSLAGKLPPKKLKGLVAKPLTTTLISWDGKRSLH
jgi:hypothetical protein